MKVCSFAISIDGYGAGPQQSLEDPLGLGGRALHEWLYPTRSFQRLLGHDTGSTGIDDDLAARGFDSVGAWIIGRNMFGPVRGPWADDGWKGWWGDNPPFHAPVFVLTHHAREPLTLAGGTTFHFITQGIHAAYERAAAVCADQDIRLGGGASTLRQYLRAGLVDELHIAMPPVLLGAGEPLFEGIDLAGIGYHCARQLSGEKATHFIITRRASDAAQAHPR
jgi:dihydrofolate reductase